MNFVKFLFKDALCLYRVLCNCLLLVTLLVLAQKCPQLGRPLTQRGFFCNDETLLYPYHKDTVSVSMLYAIGLYVPLLIIVCLEVIDYVVNIGSQRRSVSSDVVVAESLKKKQLQQCYEIVSTFLLGYACEMLFVDLGKTTIGRLRPHFIDVCQPQLTDGRTCADPLLASTYIEEYSCLGGVNVTAGMLRNAHLSFPSGHSSMSFYGMVFLALYFQHSLCIHRFGARLLKPLLQLVCLFVAWFVALSRIMDNMHHWSDVLAGSLLGTLIAVFVYVIMVGGLVTKKQPKEPQSCDCGKSVAFNEVLSEVKSATTTAKS